MCDPCRRAFPLRLTPDALPRLAGIRATRAVWPYEGNVRQILHHYKYSGLRSLAPLLAAEMTVVLNEWKLSVDMVVHVPAHRARLRERGFDQAALLTREVATVAGIPFASAMSRIRETAVQARAMDVNERAKNVQGAFEVGDPAMVRCANVLLIDDVLTTGATLRAAADALRRAGAAAVWALTLAHET